MATKTPPPPKSTKGAPPKPVAESSNLIKPEPGTSVALNFKVPAEFKRDFKIAAATHGITQSELLKRAFELWSEQNN